MEHQVVAYVLPSQQQVVMEEYPWLALDQDDVIKIDMKKIPSTKKWVCLMYAYSEENFMECLEMIKKDVRGLKEICFMVGFPYTHLVRPWKMKGIKKSCSNYSYGLLEYTRENIPKGWEDFFNKILSSEEFEELSYFLEEESKQAIIYPAMCDIWKAFHLTPPKKMRVIITGQDPYHNGQATGLSFSVDTNPIPPSLKNIQKELKSSGWEAQSGDLTDWALQGVFMYNSSLTVRKGCPGSHSDKWEFFTNSLVKYLDTKVRDIVVVAWGKHAMNTCKNFSTPHKISSPHPSPFSANTGFFGSDPFNKVNSVLKSPAIDWDI